jgi:hypothetical protein
MQNCRNVGKLSFSVSNDSFYFGVDAVKGDAKGGDVTCRERVFNTGGWHV